jgi:hypothetical protein
VAIVLALLMSGLFLIGLGIDLLIKLWGLWVWRILSTFSIHISNSSRRERCHCYRSGIWPSRNRKFYPLQHHPAYERKRGIGVFHFWPSGLFLIGLGIDLLIKLWGLWVWRILSTLAFGLPEIGSFTLYNITPPMKEREELEMWIEKVERPDR